MSMPLSIMIVEDEWDIAHLFSLSLARSGFDTITFTEPLLALGHFKQYSKRYCLILLDMFMKDLNGMDLSKEIRIHNSQVKIVMITGYCKGDLSNSIYFKEAEISEVLQKPVDLDKLGPHLLQLLSKNKAVTSNSKNH
jgi:DNA-binding NtrC family response regulator